jgi:cell division initiation protein
MELTPRLLTEVEFREQWRGYSQNEVDDFLERVAAAVAELLERLREANERAATAERRLVDLAEDDEIRRTLVLAQRTAATALEEAKAEAARIVSDAEDRKAELEREIAERTERELGDIVVRRQEIEADIATLTAFVEEQRANVRMELQRQLDALDALPDVKPPRATDVHERTTAPPAPEGSVTHPPREAPLSAPRPPTDDEVAQARDDLVEALRRAGVDALLPDAPPAVPEAEPAFEPQDVPDAPQANMTSEATRVYNLAEDDDDEDPLAWAAEATADEEDPFLAELRRAVTDTEPLGPRDHEKSPTQFGETEDDTPGGRFRLRRGR